MNFQGFSSDASDIFTRYLWTLLKPVLNRFADSVCSYFGTTFCGSYGEACSNNTVMKLSS
jgi:hypothetical protein